MITHSYVTKTGDRMINEDALVCETNQDRWLFAVADGLGGHKHGEVASAIAITTIQQEFFNNSETPLG